MQYLTIIHKPNTQLVANATKVLGEHQIDIADFDSFTQGEQQYLRVSVSDLKLGLEVLTNAGYQVITEDTVLIKVPDQPGALAKVAKSINDAGISLRSISLISNEYGIGTVAISSSDNAKVRTLFADSLIG